MQFVLPAPVLRRPFLAALFVTIASLLGSSAASAQTLEMYLSPPGEQNSTRAGALVEGFEGPTGAIGPAGVFAVGPWSDATPGVFRNVANAFGGANDSNFLSLGNGDQVTITLVGDRKYVGFWWSAGNAGNTIKFYDDSNTLLAQFTTDSLATLLGGGGNIVAIDGSSYAKADYFGNPNPPLGRNAAQPYGYINLLLKGASVNFRTIIVSHTGGGGFELDNLAVTDTATVPGTWVDVGVIPVTLPSSAIGTTDDSATTPFNTPVSGNVATNDTTVAGSTFAVLTGPSNGGVTLDPATGAYTYTPNAGFSGQDTFTYQQCKPAPDQATCVPATVRIVVGPNAADDTAGPVTQGVALNASVAGNDAAPAGSTRVVLTGPANGSVVLNSSTGAYTYTSNPAFSGTDTFTYRLCLPAPNASLCDDATVQIAVAAQVPPVASSVAIVGAPALGQPLTSSYVYTDANADLEATSAFRWVSSATNSVAAGTTVGTGSGYSPTATDVGRFLFFCVTPVAASGASPGAEVCTAGVQVSAAVSSVPTLSQWGLVLLSLGMGLCTLAFGRVRR